VVVWQSTLEELVNMFGNRYKNRRVLVTGHTGFKGSWLVLWLQMLGAKVSGISLPAETTPNHWELLGLDVESCLIDIRNEELLRQKVREIRPEMVFHLAAQPLVRRSYRQPLQTWATNVMGTANLLDACRDVEGLEAIVVVTTDKCYENKEWVWGYREIDSLGGYDPYSASKAGSELVAASYRQSFFNTPESPLLATARAGNVIGGGDWSEDRLIPDLVRAVQDRKSLEIRSPEATRPWQHVLECLSGYLMLGQQLLEGNKSCAEAWNFGPDREGNRRVKQVLAALKSNWPDANWHCTQTQQLHEAQLLHLDSGKAREKLKWQPVWTFDEGVNATADWYRLWLDEQKILSETQLQQYIQAAGARGLPWAGAPAA
jgi:CDP-glucose 4,6-dehydratase